ncbi:MAG: ECF transporter S component [Bulleidia sp.]
MTAQIHTLTLSAMFLALGLVLPFLVLQIPSIGAMLLPMHWPVFLAAYVCGGRYAALIGFLCPLLRSVLFGMPAMYPNAIAMAFELAAYGAVTGSIYHHSETKDLKAIYFSLVSGMLIGRIVWGIAETLLLGTGENHFTFQAFLAGGFISALPGILLQLILLPVLVNRLRKTGHLR